MTTLASRMQKAMTWAGHNQSTLAKAVGVSQQTVQAIVAGETRKPRFLVELAEACGVRSEWLAKGTGDMLVAGPVQGSLLSAEEAHLLGLYRSLAPPDRQAVVAVAESLGTRDNGAAGSFQRKRRA